MVDSSFSFSFALSLSLSPSYFWPIISHGDVCLTQGSFTGPRVNWSGSSLRTEATGYGLVSSSP